ncbi:MAG: extracellular solute-binding protein [Oceanococcus sp.]
MPSTNRLMRTLLSLLRVAVIVVFVVPVFGLLLASLHTPGSVPVPGDLWPDTLSLSSWAAVFEQVPMAGALLNSTLIVVLAVPISLAFASLGGFGMSRMGPRAQFWALLLVIVAASIPYSAIWLPRFLAVQTLGLGDGWLALWLPSLAGGNALLVLLYWYAIRSLPSHTVDAARLEGLGWLRIWWSVVLPQLKSIHLVAAILVAIWTWGSWLDPMLYVQREADQTAVQMLSALELMGANNWSVLAAAALLLCSPVLGALLFLAMRSAFLNGLPARHTLSVALVTTLALSLLGCSRTPADATALRLQAVADAVEAKAYRELINAFEQTHPQIQVEFMPVGRHAEHVTRLVTAYAAGKGPDLFLINFRRWGQFLRHDVLQPLGPLLAQREGFNLDDYFAPSLEAFQHQGQLLCMPQNMSSLVVYWNRSLFQRYGVAPPQTDWGWKEFHDAAVALSRDLDGDGKTDIYGLVVDPSIVRLAPFVWQADGAVVDNVNNPQRFHLRDRNSVIGMMFLKRLKNERGAMPELSQQRAQGPDARFMHGGAAMTLNSRRFTANLRNVPDLDWDVAPLPQYKQAATVLHADAYCLGKSSAHQAAAVQFVQFATSQQGQALLSASGRIVPVNKAVAHSNAFLDDSQPPASAQVFLDAVAHMRRTPNIANWYEIETRMNPLIEEWMFERPLAGNVEEMTGLRDGYRLALMIERSVGPLLLPAP